LIFPSALQVKNVKIITYLVALTVAGVDDAVEAETTLVLVTKTNDVVRATEMEVELERELGAEAGNVKENDDPKNLQ
jgi:hypothetical protein